MAGVVGACRRRIVTLTDSPRPPAQAKTQAAKAKINALFSDEVADRPVDLARDKLDALFGGRPKKPS